MHRPVVLFACAVLLAACTGAERIGVPPTPLPAPAEPALQPDDLVDLTLYFRSGDGRDAHLEAVTREVAVDVDLSRRALELLLAGPLEGEEPLAAPLPTTTRVRELRVEGGVAHVELSAEAIRDADSVGSSPGNEALALGALANTLTEFPSIDVVDVSVRSADVDRFWGGWGMPPVLVRDESLIGPSTDGEGLLDLRRFGAEPQETGSADAAPVEITAVRVRDRLTHVRVAVELGDAEAGAPAEEVPGVRCRVSGDELVVAIGGVAAYTADFPDAQALELSTDDFRELRVDHDGSTATLRLRVDDARARPFWLHTLSSPTRVILDVKKRP